MGKILLHTQTDGEKGRKTEREWGRSGCVTALQVLSLAVHLLEHEVEVSAEKLWLDEHRSEEVRQPHVLERTEVDQHVPSLPNPDPGIV